MASESDGNHPQSSSSSSSAGAPTRDNEVKPNHDRDLDDQDLDDRDAVIDYFCLDSVFALESPNTEVLPGIEGTNVRDETENLAVWCARKYWDAITEEELPAELISCSTRGTRFHARLARLGCGANYRKLECDGQGSPSGQVGRRQQVRSGEARGSQQVCREGIREHQVR